jgi:hypothetical protein
VRSQDNEIHLLRLGRLETFLERHATDHGNLPFQPTCSDTFQTGLHAVRDLCFQVLDKQAIGMREGSIHSDTPPRRRRHHMEEGHTRTKFACQAHGILQRLVGIFTKVYRDKKTLCRHPGVLSL